VLLDRSNDANTWQHACKAPCSLYGLPGCQASQELSARSRKDRGNMHACSFGNSWQRTRFLHVTIGLVAGLHYSTVPCFTTSPRIRPVRTVFHTKSARLESTGCGLSAEAWKTGLYRPQRHVISRHEAHCDLPTCRYGGYMVSIDSCRDSFHCNSRLKMVASEILFELTVC
jgi:hypothetical protein